MDCLFCAHNMPSLGIQKPNSACPQEASSHVRGTTGRTTPDRPGDSKYSCETYEAQRDFSHVKGKFPMAVNGAILVEAHKPRRMMSLGA